VCVAQLLHGLCSEEEICFADGRDPKMLIALAGWLADMGASTAWESPDLTAAAIAWLDALAALSRWALPCCQGVTSAFDGVGKMLEHAARFTASSTATERMRAICSAAAGAITAGPLPQLATLSFPPRGLTLMSQSLLKELEGSIDAALSAKLSAAVHRGSFVAWKKRRRHWRAAEETLRRLGGLAQAPEEHKNLVVSGLDLMLVHAVLRSPTTRSMRDEDELMSDCTVHAILLLVSRLRWPGAASLLLRLGQAPSLETGTSVVLALLRSLYRGNANEPRCVLPCLHSHP
jgi:hypothetical protein